MTQKLAFIIMNLLLFCVESWAGTAQVNKIVNAGDGRNGGSVGAVIPIKIEPYAIVNAVYGRNGEVIPIKIETYANDAAGNLHKYDIVNE